MVVNPDEFAEHVNYLAAIDRLAMLLAKELLRPGKWSAYL
jgi:hypothetical protein